MRFVLAEPEKSAYRQLRGVHPRSHAHHTPLLNVFQPFRRITQPASGRASAANRRAEGHGLPEGAHWPCWKPDYRARPAAATHRAAASALSSGRVLKAIAAPGAALRIALMTTSNKCKVAGRQGHAASDDHTIVVRRT